MLNGQLADSLARYLNGLAQHLQLGDRLSHIAVCLFCDLSVHAVVYLDCLLLCDLLETFLHTLRGKRGEAKARTSGDDGRNDLAGIVTQQRKARCGRVIFYNSPQGRLGVSRQRVRFLQNDQLDWRYWVRIVLRLNARYFPLGQRLDLLADDIHASIGRRVNFVDPLRIEIWAEQRMAQGLNARGLSGTLGPEEEEMGKLASRNALLEGSDSLLLVLNLVERLWPILLNPRCCRLHPDAELSKRKKNR